MAATEYLTSQQVAELRHLKPQSLRRERWRGCGPPYVRDGRRCLYPADALSEWLRARLVTPEGDGRETERG